MAIGIGTILFATAVAGGTYLFAKSKDAKNGTAAVAGVAGGAGAAVAVVVAQALLPVAIVAGIIGLPAAGFYYLGKSKGERKALGPGRD